MSSPQLPTSGIPKPLPDDDDDVSWALHTAAVQWGRGAHQDALIWLRRAAESAIELSAWSRAADLNATATRLEKQLTRLPPPSAVPVPSQIAGSLENQPPSAPPRAANLPSFPVPTTSAPPAENSGAWPDGRRQTTGYSSFPPPSSQGRSNRGLFGPTSSSPAPSNQSRSSVVIDVEEGEVELSEDEIRELESEVVSDSGIPSGAPPRVAPSSSRQSWPTGESSEPLPAFALESTRPRGGAASLRSFIPVADQTPEEAAPGERGALPSFSLEPSARTPSAESAASPGRGAGRPSPSSLPSFPLENRASSLPPVSKWPHFGSPGTSHLPPSPALPSLESDPPGRPFLDEGDDGAPGLDEHVLEGQFLQEIEPLEPDDGLTRRIPPRSPESTRPPGAIDAFRRSAAPGDLELVEIAGHRNARGKSNVSGSIGHLSVRSGRASTRPRTLSAPLPPALPDGRGDSSKPRLGRVERRPASNLPGVPVASSRAPSPSTGAERGSFQPRLPPSESVEPRMPVRTLSYASPLDFSGKSEIQASVEDRASGNPLAGDSASPGSSRETSSALTVTRSGSVDPVSVALPSAARSIEPEDLPTVSSPSLSRPPPETRPRRASERSDAEARSGEVRGSGSPFEQRRRISFKFEEPKTLDQKHEEQKSNVGREVAPEEPLAFLPPVAARPAGESKAPRSDDVVLSGVRFAEVRGLSELPASAHRLLAKTARIESLATGEEASFFSVALVLNGWVSLMPAIADTACATAVVGEVVFTEGTLGDGVMLRVVAGQDDVAVATWDADAIAEATKDCPWVADDLRLLADGFQALAGVCLGPLGDRLDDSLRSIVTSRCEIRTLLPGELLCDAGKPVPGMHIIGGGEIELVDEDGRVKKAYASGEFLFAEQVLAGGVAPFAARAGGQGALVLFAPRMAAHELLVSVPPLLEILAE